MLQFYPPTVTKPQLYDYTTAENLNIYNKKGPQQRTYSTLATKSIVTV